MFSSSLRTGTTSETSFLFGGMRGARTARRGGSRDPFGSARRAASAHCAHARALAQAPPALAQTSEDREGSRQREEPLRDGAPADEGLEAELDAIGAGRDEHALEEIVDADGAELGRGGARLPLRVELLAHEEERGAVARREAVRARVVVLLEELDRELRLVG